MTKRFPFPLIAFALLLSGCAMLRTDKSHYAGMDTMLAEADYPAAIARIETAKNKAYTGKDRAVYYLDIGMLYHWNAEYEKSNEYLEKAERAIEDNFASSLTGGRFCFLYSSRRQRRRSGYTTSSQAGVA